MTRRESLKLFGLLGLRAAWPAGVGRAAPVEPPITVDRAIADGITGFGCDLFAKLRTRRGNLFFSPLSIEAALAMTRLGAHGETLEEMNKVLRVPAPRAHSGIGAYLQNLEAQPGAKYELAIANALWLQRGMAFRPEFLAETKRYFDAATRTVDFRELEQVRQTINEWVKQQTKGKIKNLFAHGTLSTEMRLVLTNAVYFKGKWSDPFNKGMTKDETFHLSNGKPIQAPMMRRHGEYRYFGDKNVQLVELPYAGGRISMLVILPADAVENDLTAEQLQGWVGKMHSSPGEVLLPRFTTTSEFDLGETLQDMGMKSAFSQSANFSGMCAEPLMISKVIHKAFVETNEEGSEAAAATGVAMAPRAAAPDPQKPFTFRADRPFVFAIRDTLNGTPIFIGRVANPLT